MSAEAKLATTAVAGVPREHAKLARAIERVLVELVQLNGSRGAPLPADTRFGSWACAMRTHVEVKTSSAEAADFIESRYGSSHIVERTLSTKRIGHRYILTITPRT